MRIRGFAPSTPCWVELTTSDPVGSAAFYAELFGWQLEGERFLLDGRAVAGLITGRRGARWQPSFQAADTAELSGLCSRLGGRIAAGPVEMGLGSYVEAVDPFGATFAITAPMHRPVELSVAYNDVIGMELTYGG